MPILGKLPRFRFFFEKNLGKSKISDFPEKISVIPRFRVFFIVFNSKNTKRMLLEFKFYTESKSKVGFQKFIKPRIFEYYMTHK